MKHFQSKVLTAAILAALSGSAIAAENVYTTSDVDTKITEAKTEVTNTLKKEITAAKEELATKLADQNKSGKEDIKKIKTAVGNIAKLLHGEEGNEENLGIVKSIDTLNSSVTENQSDIDNLYSNLDETNSALDATTNALNEATGQFDTFATSTVENIKAIDKKLEDVSNAVSDHADKFNDIADSLDEVNTKADEAVNTANEAKQLAEETKNSVDENVKAAKKAAEDAKAEAGNAQTAADKAEAAAAKVTDIEEAAEVALIAAHKNTQDIHGFKEEDIIYKKDKKNGNFTATKATKADVEADDFKGLGLKEVVAKHDESLGELTEIVNENSEALVKTAEVVNEISTDVKDTKDDLALVAATAINNAQEINGFKAGDDIYDIGEDGTITKKEATAADVEADDFKGLGLKEVVAKHDQSLEDLTETVNENGEALVKTAEVVNEISTDVKANTAAIAEKADKTELDKVSKKADKNADDIATKAEKTELDKVSKKANKNADDIATKANSADVYTKDKVYTKEESDNKFVKINDSIGDLNTTTNGLETRLAAAEKSVADHGTRLASAEKSITEHGTRLNGLDKAVSDLRKETRQGLAEQAALSGLFQPYNVGRFNVTAAVGGYKSESAVAIGTGFRFTENFAAKAGVAVGTSSGSSAAYHVGVNYEW